MGFPWSKKPQHSPATTGAALPPKRGAQQALRGVRDGDLGRDSAVAAPPQPNIYNQFNEVPKFSRVLTGGDKPVATLSAAEKKHAIALELPNHAALILVDPAADTETLGKILYGQLVKLGFSLGTAKAPAALIKQLYGDQSTNAAGSSARGTTDYHVAVREWIDLAVQNRATDIHLEINGNVGLVRLRVDGDMEPLRNACKGMYPADFVNNCMAQLFNTEASSGSASSATFDSSKFLYCMIPYNELAGKNLNLRYQSFAGFKGPKVVMRLLPIDETSETLTFTQLGYAPSQVAEIEQAQATPTGMIMIAGVTGSGKSTSLQSFAELSPYAASSAAYSIEDPVEKPYRGVHQIQLQRDPSKDDGSAVAFKAVSVAMVRGDPDFVIFGEIRDKHSAAAAQQNAETGHLSAGTVHAHLLSGIVPRLINPEIGMSRATLTAPNMLTLLIYQALVPVLCKHCALTTDEIKQDSHEKIAHAAIACVEKMSLPTNGLRFRRIGGCEHCQNRGTVGQTVVAETLLPDESWLLPIRESRDVEAENIRRNASDGDLLSPNMAGKTVFEHTLFKALQGGTDLRQCSRFNSIERFTKEYMAKRSSNYGANHSGK